MEIGWKETGIIISAIVGLLAIGGAVYKADCYNVRTVGSELFVAESELPKDGAEHFVTNETYLAGQRKIEKQFDSWELKSKMQEIAELDRRYGVGCAKCDPKLKQYYNWLVIERDRLIRQATGR